jgi:hypothetical protein
MDGLKLAHAVHDRWPAIKIILVSGQIKLADADKPTDSRFFGKPLEVKRMINELQDMVGTGTLKIVPDSAVPVALEMLASKVPAPTPPTLAAQESLTAENDNLACCWNRPELMQRSCLPKPGSMPRNARPPTSCRS